MKNWQKTRACAKLTEFCNRLTILIIICVLGMGVSFAYHLFKDPDIVGEIKAPVHVNIEIDKNFMHFVSVIAALNPGDTLYRLYPTTNVSSIMQPVVLYSEIKTEAQVPFVHALSLRIPKKSAAEVMDAIDGISVFIGNKAFYFSHSQLIALPGREQGAYLLYKLPGLEYKKSLIGSWINWYGDFNLAVKTAMAFFVYPAKFFITWLFLICLLVICRSEIAGIYCVLRKQHILLLELLPLGLVVAAGCMLRLNGYIRHSSWFDELYAACTASNPGHPFLSTFEDPGNPPLYFILLRFWFMIFGWTEQSGRLFSALLGSAAVISLYVMVKRFTNRKTALLAAVFMAVNTCLIGYSQEIRGYILEVFLVPLAGLSFLGFNQKNKQTITDLVWYVIPSILLVNTHYYGGLLVFANFLFFAGYSIITKTFNRKKTVLFMLGNAIIVLSLLPFFVHTALRRALLDQNFNAWLLNHDFPWKYILLFIFLILIPLIFIRRTVLQKIMSGHHCQLFDYIIFVTVMTFLTACGVSLYRPVLYSRYFIILVPFLLTAFAIVAVGIFENCRSNIITGLCVIGVYVCILAGYEAEPGGRSGTHFESHVYISRDLESHPENRCAEYPAEDSRLNYAEVPGFYAHTYTQLPLYVHGGGYDVLYISPDRWTEERTYAAAATFNINPEKILRIRVNETTSVFKIYL
jgi:hypothetical protein